MRRLAGWGRSLNDRMRLQTKLIAVMVVLATGAMALSGIAGTLVLHTYLVRQVDTQLTHSAEELTELEFPITQTKGDTSVSQDSQTIQDSEELNEQGGPGESADRDRPGLTLAFYSCVFDTSGNPVGEATLRVPYGDEYGPPKLPRIDATTVKRLRGDPFTIGGSTSDEKWRVLVEETKDGSIAVVAFSLDQVGHTISKLILAEVLFGILVLLILVGVGYIIIRSSLRPLMRVEATAEAIAAGDLSRRVPSSHDTTEVGRLAKALNAMLGQIEVAFRDREESTRRAKQSAVVASASETAARASEARMRRFVADAGHELRTPLTSIRGFSELLQRQIISEPEAIVGTVGRIQAAAVRMTTLVEDLLLLARLDQRRPLRHDPVDLLDLVADVVTEFRITTPGHSVELAVNVDTAPAVVSGDEIRLRQVVSNLLTNAGMHTPCGTRVTVAVDTTETTAVISVQDDGPGLAPDDADRVFERFYRVDPSRTRASGGTGLGLAIVASLVEAHGGAAEVISVDGEGARFVVRLPLRVIHSSVVGEGAT